MTEQEIKNEILSYVLSEFAIDEIQEVEVNAGSCYMTMKDGETYFLMVEKCETDE